MRKKLFPPFLGCFQSNPFRCREAGKHGQSVPAMPKMCKYSQYQQVSIRSGTEAYHHIPSFSVGSVRARSIFPVDSADSKNSYECVWYQVFFASSTSPSLQQ